MKIIGIGDWWTGDWENFDFLSPATGYPIHGMEIGDMANLFFIVKNL